MEDRVERKRLRKSVAPYERLNPPWNQAFRDFVGGDSRRMPDAEVHQKREERLRDELRVKIKKKVEGVEKLVIMEDVGESVRITKSAILEILDQERSRFSLTALRQEDWRRALNRYLILLAHESRRPKPGGPGLGGRLRLRLLKLGNVIRTGVEWPQGYEKLLGLLELKNIHAGEQALRLLISEINQEREKPRILGFIHGFLQNGAPQYALLPQDVNYPQDFLTVCKIFDH